MKESKVVAEKFSTQYEDIRKAYVDALLNLQDFVRFTLGNVKDKPEWERVNALRQKAERITIDTANQAIAVTTLTATAKSMILYYRNERLHDRYFKALDDIEKCHARIF